MLSDRTAAALSPSKRSLRLGHRRRRVLHHAHHVGHDGAARRLHHAAQPRIRLVHGGDLVGAGDPAPVVRADGAVFGRLHRHLRHAARGSRGDRLSADRGGAVAVHDAALAPRRPLGLPVRHRQRDDGAGARRTRRQPLVRAAAWPRARHADGEFGDGAARLSPARRLARGRRRLAHGARPLRSGAMLRRHARLLLHARPGRATSDCGPSARARDGHPATAAGRDGAEPVRARVRRPLRGDGPADVLDPVLHLLRLWSQHRRADHTRRISSPSAAITAWRPSRPPPCWR